MASTKIKKQSKKPAATKRKKQSPAVNRSGRADQIRAYVLPAILIAVILGCIGFLGMMGYRTVAASEFFDVKRVDVRGVSRASKDEIEKIVTSQTQHSGVWNADLIDLKAKIEKLTFVRSAAVSRVLPNGIRVGIVERQPQAIVSLSSGDYIIDENGEIITAAKKGEDQAPVVIRGWDEAKTERALKDNQQRIKLYQKMMVDWDQFQLAKRVKEVNLSDMQEPKAIIEDSGANISVALAKDNFAKSLKAAIEAVAGKGQKIKAVDSAGVYPVIEYIGN
ncbi:MAG: FtsQ-type POTRA domain-containing protein [Acidobacteriota bacterium]